MHCEMRNCLCVFTLLLPCLFGHTGAVGNITSAAAIRNPRATDEETAAALEKIQTIVKITKTFSTHVPVVGQYASAVFGLVEIVIDRQIPDRVDQELKKLGNQLIQASRGTSSSEIMNDVQQVKEICAGSNFERIISKTGALFRLLNDAIFQPVGKKTFKVESFLEAGKKFQPMLKIYSIPELIVSPQSNTLKSALEADPFHRISTIEGTRKTILATLNTLAFIEAFRIKMNKTTNISYQVEREAAAIKSVIQIDAMMKNHINNYAKLEYFPRKVSNVIEAVMNEMKSKNSSIQAQEMMRRLEQFHTNDRFIVIMSPVCAVKEMFSGLPDNVYANETRGIVVYRSKSIHAMSVKNLSSWGVAQKDVYLSRCIKPKISAVLEATSNVGLAVYRKSGCEVIIENGSKAGNMKIPFGPGKYGKVCNENNPGFGFGQTNLTYNMTFPEEIYVYPS